jgi:hypothetical protein
MVWTRVSCLKENRKSYTKRDELGHLTICLAVITTVFVLNLRPHISKRSSKLGPSKSMTRML